MIVSDGLLYATYKRDIIITDYEGIILSHEIEEEVLPSQHLSDAIEKFKESLVESVTVSLLDGSFSLVEHCEASLKESGKFMASSAICKNLVENFQFDKPLAELFSTAVADCAIELLTSGDVKRAKRRAEDLAISFAIQNTTNLPISFSRTTNVYDQSMFGSNIRGAIDQRTNVNFAGPLGIHEERSHMRYKKHGREHVRDSRSVGVHVDTPKFGISLGVSRGTDTTLTYVTVRNGIVEEVTTTQKFSDQLEFKVRLGHRRLGVWKIGGRSRGKSTYTSIRKEDGTPFFVREVPVEEAPKHLTPLTPLGFETETDCPNTTKAADPNFSAPIPNSLEPPKLQTQLVDTFLTPLVGTSAKEEVLRQDTLDAPSHKGSLYKTWDMGEKQEGKWKGDVLF